MITDYERGVEQASKVYKDVIREYVAENNKMRELIRHMYVCSNHEYTEYDMDIIASRCEDCEYDNDCGRCDFESRMAELGIGVNK